MSIGRNRGVSTQGDVSTHGDVRATGVPVSEPVTPVNPEEGREGSGGRGLPSVDGRRSEYEVALSMENERECLLLLVTALVVLLTKSTSSNLLLALTPSV